MTLKGKIVHANMIKTSLKDLVKDWQFKSGIEKDNHIAISGDEGDGKTHLMCETILEFPGTNLRDNIIYTADPKEFEYKYDLMKEESVLGFDEALDKLDRLDWNKMETKQLVKFVRGQVRKEKKGTFLYNVQLFRDLHGYWRNHRIRYWLELTPRELFDGVNFAFVLERMRVPFITGKRDVWLMDDNEKIWLNAMSSKSYSPYDYINNLRRHAFYKGEFKFKPLSDNLKEKYMKYRLEAIQEYIKDSEEMEEKLSKHEKMYRGKWLDMCLWAKNTYDLNLRELAKLNYMNEGNFGKLLREREETIPKVPKTEEKKVSD